MTTWQAFLATLIIALYLVLNVAILRKAGLSPWWTLLSLFPPAYVAGIWVFAFARWPRVDRVRVTPPSDYEGGWNVDGGDGPDRRRDD